MRPKSYIFYLQLAALFGATVTIFFLPMLWGNILLPPASDLAVQYYPYFHFYTQALHAGESILWVPQIYSGFPAYISQVAGFLDPLNLLLGKLFVAPFMLELRLMLDLTLTMVCAYAAARALGIARLPAALVGPSYLLAFDWLYLSNPVIANSIFLLPLLLFCLARFLNGAPRRWWYPFLGGAGLGWALLCGYTQVLFYAVVLVGIYAAVYALVSRFSLRELGNTLIALAIVGVVGAAVALPQLLPAYKFLPYTSRAEASSYQNITLKVIAPGDLLTLLVPPNVYVPYVTPGRKPLFVGALWMLLGLGALGLAAAALRRRQWVEPNSRHLVAVSAAFAFAFIAAVKWSPLYWLLNHLPVFSLFRFPFRFMFLGAFLLALLGAFGFERAGELVERRFFRIAAYIVGGVGAVFVGGVVFVQLLGERGAAWFAGIGAQLFNATLHGHAGFNKNPAEYAHAFERGLAAYRELLSLGSPSVLLPLMCLLASAALAVLFVRRRLMPEQFKKAAVVLSLVTVLSVGIGGWSAFAPQELYGYPNPFIEHMPDLDLYRVYPFLPGEAAAEAIPPQYKLSDKEAAAIQALASAGELSDLNLIHNVPSVDGYDQFEPAAILQAMGEIGGELAAGYGAGTTAERTERLFANIGTLSRMSGKYVISGVPLVSPKLTFVASSSVTDYRMTLYLYKNPKALPIYFLAPAGCTECAPATGTLVADRISNGRFEFSVKLAAPRTLVLAQSNLPGWQALLDSAPVAIRRVNQLYMGVEVPTGEHVVSFEYRGMLNELAWLRTLNIVR